MCMKCWRHVITQWMLNVAWVFYIADHMEIRFVMNGISITFSKSNIPSSVFYVF